LVLLKRGPWLGFRAGEGRARRFPARSGPGSEEKVGEENKEAEANL